LNATIDGLHACRLQSARDILAFLGANPPSAGSQRSARIMPNAAQLT
jgi:hypothetical protein